MYKNIMPNGCSYSNPFIFPNISKLSTKVAMTKEWYVGCKFYDPTQTEKYPNGYFWRKKGLAEYKTFKEKLFAAKILLEEMQIALDRFYNPIPEKRFFQTMEAENDYSPELYLIEALKLAFKDHSETVSKHYSDCIKSNLNIIEPIIINFKYDYLKIKEVELKHIKKILDYCDLTANSYNDYRKHLSALFKILCANSCLVQNPCQYISKKQHIRKIVEVLTKKQFDDIYSYLVENHPDFANYMQIFHMSGGRSTELLGIKKSDVNIKNQEFVVTIKKRKLYVREYRAIILDAIPFWEKQLEKCSFDNEYLFGAGFSPEIRTAPLSNDSPGIYWKKYVKNIFGINVNFYPLKHLFLDKIAELYGMEAAQDMAGHMNGKTTEIYTIFKKKRELEKLKKLSIN